jgi:hypothetical protein
VLIRPGRKLTKEYDLSQPIRAYNHMSCPFREAPPNGGHPAPPPGRGEPDVFETMRQFILPQRHGVRIRLDYSCNEFHDYGLNVLFGRTPADLKLWRGSCASNEILIDS